MSDGAQAAVRTVGPSDELSEHWTRAADGLLRDARLPALAVGLHRGGKLVWFHGAADGAASPPISASTVFRIASITKLFTASSLLLAQQQGQLSIDDAVAHFVPTFPFASITIRELLVHGSGLQRETPGDRGWQTGHFLLGRELGAAVQYAVQVQPPLARWKYSNLGYNLLGEVLATATGEAFSAYVKRSLIDTVGLVDSTFDRRSIRPQDLATGHRRPPDGGWEPDPYDELPVPAPAGGLYSSIRDLARFGAFLVGDIPGPLADSALQLIRQPVLAVDESDVAQAQAIGPLVLKRPGSSWLGHAGGLSGYASWFLVSATSGLGCIALTNVGDGDGLFDLCAAVMEAAEEQLEPVARQVHSDASVGGLLIGRYWGDGTTLVLKSTPSGLAAHWETARGGTSRPMRMTLLGPNRVRADEGPFVGEEGTFDTDAEGRPTEFAISGYRYVKVQ